MSLVRILGIDPGYDRMGVAVIETSGVGAERVLYSTCLSSSPKTTFSERLHCIVTGVAAIIAEYAPTILALENLFVTKNQKTAMRVAEVRGALIYYAQTKGLAIYEYTPLQVKAAVLGDGRGTKEAMMRLIQKMILVRHDIVYDDEFDAIAVGITCSVYEKPWRHMD